ncbi:oxygenase MpaB family protein [Gordonia sp. (in: high G+C Gram-positive bacteria)]|uniref:oxygenase MpaB family protein n=1 Tax=Gordonia sp. (in: high G+C Gram-positive bacteria) TaxID=84139 RepID=UPI003F9D7448
MDGADTRIQAEGSMARSVVGDDATDEPERTRRGRRGYVPDWRDTVPTLTVADTRITITTPQRKPNDEYHRADLQDAFDFWAAAGSATNVAMQLGWREVAYGVMESKVESGALMHHPWKRLRTTATYLAVAVLGTQDERDAYRDAINTAHRHVRDDENSPVKYNAFNRELQMWVAACLYIGFEDAHELLHGKMDDEQAEQFYAGASSLGTTLQVTEEMWPSTRREFDHYWNAACERISYDETQIQFINDLIDLKMITPMLGLPLRGLLRFLSIGMMPPLFREKIGLRWRAVDQRRFANLFLFVGFVNRFLPRPLRFGSFYFNMSDLRRKIEKNKDLI